MTDSGRSDIPWGPRPRDGAVGCRPTPDGIELMIGRPGEPTEFILMTRRETKLLRQALAQALRDHQLGVSHTIR
jgi:hypothetical protein